MKSFKVVAFVLSACFAFAAQAQGLMGTSTGYNTYQAPIQVYKAIVLGVRDVKLTTEGQQQNGMMGMTQGGSAQQMLGGAVGGLLGGLLGRKSGDYAIMATTTMIGTVIGGVVTAAPTVREAQEIVYLIDGAPNPVAITQAVTDGVKFSPGQPVMVLGQGRIAPMF